MRCVLLTIALAAVRLLARAQNSVPYIGCPDDGQTGPYAAAKGSPKPVNLPPATAGQLAWYEYNGDAGTFGTLGARRWNCFATIGSNGWTLYIAPAPLDSAKLLEHNNWTEQSPSTEIGRLEVIAAVALCLAPDEASNLNGVELTLDDGFSAIRIDDLDEYKIANSLI